MCIRDSFRIFAVRPLIPKGINHPELFQGRQFFRLCFEIIPSRFGIEPTAGNKNWILGIAFQDAEPCGKCFQRPAKLHGAEQPDLIGIGFARAFLGRVCGKAACENNNQTEQQADISNVPQLLLGKRMYPAGRCRPAIFMGRRCV